MRSTLTTARMARLTTALLFVLALPASVRAQEVLEYYGTDALGTVRVVYTPAGTLVARTDLLPFGEPLEATPGGPAEQFTGQERDPEAGLDYFHARMYQPRAGRFTGVDPVYAGLFDPQQWNRYAYVRNSPLGFADPTGMFAVDTNCRPEQGAYWCPGSLFIPNRYDPSAVDNLFNADRQGYQGGEALAMAEMGYAGAVDRQFMQRYEQSRTPTAETSGRLVPPEEAAQAGTGTCSGPGPGCKAVSLHPGQPPMYVPESEFAETQRLQLLGAAVGAGLATGAVAAEYYAVALAARMYPNAGGGGLILMYQGKSIFRLDWHWIDTKRYGRIFVPHVDIRGVTKHWPWPK